MSLATLRLGPRLALGFGVIVMLCALALGYGINRIASVRDISTRLGTVDAERLALSERWGRAIESNTARSWVLFFATDARIKSQLEREIQQVVAAQSVRLKRMSEIATSDSDRALLASISKQRDTYQALRKSLLARQQAGEDITADLYDRMFPAAQAYSDVVEQLIASQRRNMNRTQARAERTARLGIEAMAGGGVLALLLALLLAWRLTRSIVAPIAQAQALARAIADGDLTQLIEIQGRDEAAALLESLREMQGSLARMVGHVLGSAETIRLASGEVAQGNQDLSARTEQAAANLQQASSSMEQLSGIVGLSAESARQANRLAGAAAAVAARGGSVVAEVVTTMDEINGSSKRIADIIGVIDGIAFQTNILALNAAVEAARAGEQGRGFAVVASEVRSLAHRSADAAREIKTLIGTSVDKVEAGARLVAEAGSTMGEIVASVQRVSDIIGEISSATSEQAGGIGQVTRSVAELDQMTQRNAALVEQSAAAASSLQEQAQQLAQAAAQFRVGDRAPA
ncbi:MAG: HAMP domain-containing protein [Burkholderiales bacterium]|nr:HAMP domain-containing protein [Burkholderiales bacterium]